ncbi:hypothetical protein DNU06_17490 [Putridiphycobacter roseus]|uniref:Uncharacterized protein n=3 Tax=Putridiphycobacter roseus TaxID=2219161 RepID=A0A2W1N922_9FLAO|nr:hypothetical protein DNU06_17490 [Putridiphycobacter roseus]
MFLFGGFALDAQTTDSAIYVGYVISDTTTFKKRINKSPLESILESNNKIEIRFKTSSTPKHTEYLILTFNEKWNAKFYSFKPNTDSLISKDITSKTNIDTLFSKLVTNNIFSLPDQDSLKTEKYSYNPGTNEFYGTGMGIGCGGICYNIQFKIGYLYRQYNYCNPEDFADFYTHVYELRNFTNIVDIFSALTIK